MKYHAFVSYPSNIQNKANMLVEYLRGSAIKTFWDEDIKPGEEHRKNLELAIKNSCCMLVVIGKDGIRKWQEVEIDLFCSSMLSNDNSSEQKIIPILLGHVDLNHHTVPDIIKRFQHICLSDPVDKDFKKLQELIKTIVNSKAHINGEIERPITALDCDRLIVDTINFYNKNAEQFYEAWKNKIPLHAMDDFLAKIPRKNSKILDAGCGPGHHSIFIQNNKHEVTGIDLSEGALKIASSHNNNIEFKKMDLRKLDFNRNTFDGIWAAGSCVHLPREQFVASLFEFLRVLKPGGVLGISLHIEKLAEKKEDGRFFEMYNSLEELETLMEFVGFEILNDNEEITRDNTMGQKRVKKWAAIRAKAVKDIKIKCLGL